MNASIKYMNKMLMIISMHMIYKLMVLESYNVSWNILNDFINNLHNKRQ